MSVTVGRMSAPSMSTETRRTVTQSPPSVQHFPSKSTTETAHTHRHIHTNTETKTVIETATETETEAETGAETGAETEAETETETETETDTHAHTQSHTNIVLTASSHACAYSVYCVIKRNIHTRVCVEVHVFHKEFLCILHIETGCATRNNLVQTTARGHTAGGQHFVA